jgi:hypothetical protein
MLHGGWHLKIQVFEFELPAAEHLSCQSLCKKSKFLKHSLFHTVVETGEKIEFTFSARVTGYAEGSASVQIYSDSKYYVVYDNQRAGNSLDDVHENSGPHIHTSSVQSYTGPGMQVDIRDDAVAFVDIVRPASDDVKLALRLKVEGSAPGASFYIQVTLKVETLLVRGTCNVITAL